jgi:hypothetical protein
VADALRGAGALPNDHTAPALLRLDASLAYTNANSALSHRLCRASLEATRLMELDALSTVQHAAKAELGVVGELKTALMCAFDAMSSGRVVDIEDGGPEGVQRSALAALGALRAYTASAGRRRCRRRAAGRESAALDKIEIAAVAKAKLAKLVSMLAKIGLGNDESVLIVSDAVGRAAAELLQLWGTTQSILGCAAPADHSTAGLGARFEATLWSLGERVAGRSPTLEALTAHADWSRADDVEERSGGDAALASGTHEVRTAAMQSFARWIATPSNESTLGAIDWPVAFGGVRGTAVATDVAAGVPVFRTSHRVLLTPLHALRCGATCLRDTPQGHAFCTTHAEVGMLTLALLFQRRRAARRSAERAAHLEVLAAIDDLGCSADARCDAARALLALVGNALAGAASEAQRCVRAGNASFARRLGRHAGAARALRAIGFAHDPAAAQWVLPRSVASLRLAAVHAVLTAKYAALGALVRASGALRGADRQNNDGDARSVLDSALRTLADDAGDAAAHDVALSMLAIIATNASAAADAPSTEATAEHAKHRRLRRSNPAFRRKVGSVRGSAGVLRAIGFVRDLENEEGRWTEWTLAADASPRWLAYARVVLVCAAAVARAVALATSPPAKFAPYIASLPAEYPTCVDLWSPEELALCDDDEMTARGAAMRAQREACRADLGALAAEFPAQFELISDVGDAEFTWAWHSVTTRAFSIPNRWVIDRFFRSEGGGHFAFAEELPGGAASSESSDDVDDSPESESAEGAGGGHWWDAAEAPAASASTLSERDIINRVVAGRRSMSVLVPILDLLNHCPGSPTTLTLNGDDVVVVAQSAHRARGEVCIDYGKGLGLSRFQLLHTFGFVPWQSMTHDGDCVEFRCAAFLAAPGARYSASVLARAGAALGNSRVRLLRGSMGRAMRSLRLFRLVALTLKGKAEGVPHAALDAPQARPVELLAVHLAKSTLLAFLASKTFTLEEDCAALSALRSASAARAAEDGEAAAVARARRELALAYRIGVHVVVREHLRFLAVVLSVVKAAFAGGAKTKSPALSAVQLGAAIHASDAATDGRGTAIGAISDADKAEAVAYVTQWCK